MELLENLTYRKFFRLNELIDWIEGRGPNGIILTIEDEMVKFPARFILYCMSSCAIPSMFMDSSGADRTMLDGNKRIRTILNFMDNKFPLETGEYFKDIPGYLKFRIQNLKLEIYCIYPGNTSKNLLIKYIKEIE